MKETMTFEEFKTKINEVLPEYTGMDESDPELIELIHSDIAKKMTNEVWSDYSKRSIPGKTRNEILMKGVDVAANCISMW